MGVPKRGHFGTPNLPLRRLICYTAVTPRAYAHACITRVRVRRRGTIYSTILSYITIHCHTARLPPHRNTAILPTSNIHPPPQLPHPPYCCMILPADWMDAACSCLVVLPLPLSHASQQTHNPLPYLTTATIHASRRHPRSSAARRTTLHGQAVPVGREIPVSAKPT